MKLKRNKLLAMLLSAAMVFSLAACGGGEEVPEESAAPVVEEPDTGDASLDNTRNQDDIGSNELLVVSFGTSFNDSRRMTIGAIEQAMEDNFPAFAVRRGFTSQIIIDHVKDRDGVAIDNVTEALDRAVANGVKNLVVQPTHLMNGLEYNELKDVLASYGDSFTNLALGEPILTTDADFDAVMTAITEDTKDLDDGETAIVFMGHGTSADSNAVYAQMQDKLTEAGFTNYFIGTVEATPSLDDVLAAVGKGEYKKVVLSPLMIVAGDHANNDMASEEEDSWNTAFKNAGYEVTCRLRGLGELEAIQNILVEHAEAAMATLDEDFTTGDASLDDPRNADEIGENELLVVSFGTSFNDSRRLTIGAVEAAMEKAFPDLSVRRGFTSQIIIDHVMDRDGEDIDNITEALDRAVANGVKNLYVQPTHLMNGLEYNELKDTLAGYADSFEKISMGEPILTTDADFNAVIKAITEDTKDLDDGKTAIVYMGHGTSADSNAVYAKMQDMLTAAGYANYFIGTVEATPSLDDVLAAVNAGAYEKVILSPLMIVAGDHAHNDMASDEEGSWNSAFTAAGYEVECRLQGLGELEAIQNILVEHAQAAVNAG